MPKERPILFSADMVNAILSGNKTQTRRAVKGTALGWLNEGFKPDFVAYYENNLCPYGQVGEELWVRETFCYKYDDKKGYLDEYYYRATTPDVRHVDSVEKSPWKPSIHMPRKASRIQLRITDINIERLQDLSPEDAEREGVFCLPDKFHQDAARHYCGVKTSVGAVEYFHMLWRSINGGGQNSWEANPWVWVVSFELMGGKDNA